MVKKVFGYIFGKGHMLQRLQKAAAWATDCALIAGLSTLGPRSGFSLNWSETKTTVACSHSCDF